MAKETTETIPSTLDGEIQDLGQPTFKYCQLNLNTGDSVDVLSWLVEAIIYEDIFSPTLTGYITLRDTVNLFDRVGISGLESFTLKFWSNGYADPNNLNYIHRTFRILKVTDISLVNEYTKEYTLWFASPELLINERLKLSRAYFDCTNSKIVSDIMTGDSVADEISGIGPQGLDFPDTTIQFESIPPVSPYLNTTYTESWFKKEDDKDSVELFIEKTRYKEPVVSFPYSKPFDIINQLASKSLRASTGRYGHATQPANFMFFENKRGYQFISLDSLLESKDISFTKFRYGSALQNVADQERVLTYETIDRLEFRPLFDIIQNLNNGMYTSMLYSFDVSTGEVKEYKYDILENFSTHEETDSKANTEIFPGFYLDGDSKNDELTQAFLAKRLFVTSSPSSTVSTITSKPTERLNDANTRSGPAEYLQSRLSSLARLSNVQLLFEIQGNSKHKVGDCVDIELMELRPLEGDKNTSDFKSVPSKYYSGKYLLTSIKHVISKDDYRMIIEGSKSSHLAKFGK